MQLTALVLAALLAMASAQWAAGPTAASGQLSSQQQAFLNQRRDAIRQRVEALFAQRGVEGVPANIQALLDKEDLTFADLRTIRGLIRQELAGVVSRPTGVSGQLSTQQQASLNQRREEARQRVEALFAERGQAVPANIQALLDNENLTFADLRTIRGLVRQELANAAANTGVSGQLSSQQQALLNQRRDAIRQKVEAMFTQRGEDVPDNIRALLDKEDLTFADLRSIRGLIRQELANAVSRPTGVSGQLSTQQQAFLNQRREEARQRVEALFAERGQAVPDNIRALLDNENLTFADLRTIRGLVRQELTNAAANTGVTGQLPSQQQALLNQRRDAIRQKVEAMFAQRGEDVPDNIRALLDKEDLTFADLRSIRALIRQELGSVRPSQGFYPNRGPNGGQPPFFGQQQYNGQQAADNQPIDGEWPFGGLPVGGQQPLFDDTQPTGAGQVV